MTTNKVIPLTSTEKDALFMASKGEVSKKMVVELEKLRVKIEHHIRYSKTSWLVTVSGMELNGPFHEKRTALEIVNYLAKDKRFFDSYRSSGDTSVVLIEWV